MWAAVRTTAVSSARTWTLVAAMPHRSTGSASSSQPSTGSRPSRARTSSRSAPASTSDAQRHVAGDAGEAVEPGDVRAHLSIRSTAQAAPKPLSMPTTVTPAAHDASMAEQGGDALEAAP